MKKTIMTMAVLAFSAALSPAALATQGANILDVSNSVRSHRFRPCEYWQYVSSPSGVSGYICSYTGMTIEVPDSFDLDMVLRDYQKKVQDLETRLEDLEKKLEERS